MPAQVQEALFGEHLRRERELRGVSLEEVSVGTRIPPRYLEAIESEQWELLPGGVFNRGYVRAIAKFLGLGEDDMLAEYEIASRPAREAAAAAAPLKPEEPPPRDLTPLYLFLAGCVAILLLLALGVHMLRPRVVNWLKSRPSHAAVAEPLPMPDVPSADSTAAAAVHDPAAAPGPVPLTAPAAGAPNQPAGQSAPIPRAPSSTPAAVASKPLVVAPAPVAAAPAPVPPPVGNAATSVPAAATPASAGASSGTLELKLEVKKRTKVMVNGDGRVLVSRVLSPGDTRTYQANDHFDVAAKDPSAVRLELNGHLLPPLVSTSGRWNITLTQESLKKSAGGSH